MSDHDPSSVEEPEAHTDPDTPRDAPTEPPVSSSWPAVNAPWGTPGNHLTGPIPKLRRRNDGSFTHGEES